MQNINKNISDRLKILMETHYMTQKDLAEALGVSQTAVYSWVNGMKAPRMDKIDKIADLFNVKRSYVLGLDVDYKHDTGEPFHVELANSTFMTETHESTDLRVLFAYVSKFLDLSKEKQKQIKDYIDFLAEKDGK